MHTPFSSDQAIVRSVLRGNKKAFGRLVNRYGDAVYGVAYAHLRNTADAEDVTQEAFVRLYQWLDRTTEHPSLGPWLARVARNAAIDILRKRSRERPLDEERGATHSASAPSLERQEMHQLVWEQLREMGEAEREILVLHYFQGTKIRDIARLFGISSPAAAKRLQRAREALGRQMIASVGEDMCAPSAGRKRRERIIAAVAAAPVVWRPSALLAASGAAVVGASAAKTLMGVAVGSIVLLLALLSAWQWWRAPYRTQDITAESTFSVAVSEPSAARPEEAGDGKQQEASGLAEAPAQPIRVESACTAIRGIVTDENGRSVPGAEVTLDNTEAVDLYTKRLARKNRYPHSVSAYSASQRADEQGCFAFFDVPEGADPTVARMRLAAGSAQGFGTKTIFNTPGAKDRFYELVLRPSASLTGYVVDEAGTGVGGAQVYPFVYADYRPPQEVTAEDGSFAFAHIPPGGYEFMVTAEGFCTLKQNEWIDVGQREVIFQVERGLSASGRVVDAADGSPLPGIVVAAFSESATSTNWRATTDSAGQFSLSGLAACPYTLVLRDRPEEGTGYVQDETVVADLSSGQSVKGLVVKAARGATVSGRILNAKDKTPLPNARVIFVCESDGCFSFQGFSREDGAYSVSPLRPGQYKVTLVKDTASVDVAFNLPSLKSVEGVDFEMKAHAVLSGTVVDGEGIPVAGAPVLVQPSKEWARGTTTDLLGNFALYVLERIGPFYLQAAGQGCVSRLVGPVRGGSHTLVLEPAARIEGSVVNRRGEPLANTMVCAVPGQTALISMAAEADSAMDLDGCGGACVTTEASGTFQFDPLLPGAYQLDVYPGGVEKGSPAATATAYVEAGQTLETRLVVDTGAFAAIEGTTTVGDVPTQGVRVKVECSKGGVESQLVTSSGADGWYRFPVVVPGTVTISVHAMAGQGRIQQTREVVVAAGQTATVDFSIDLPNAGIEGYVTMNGKPMFAAVTITPSDQEGDSGKVEVQTDAAGYYHTSALREGQYDVNAQDAMAFMQFSQMPPQQVVETKDGETVRCDINIEAGGIEGTVLGIREDERASAGLLPYGTDIASLAFSMTDSILAAIDVKADHSFELTDIPPGVYYLGAMAFPADQSVDEASALRSLAAGRYGVVEVEVQAGQVTVAEVPLP